MVEPNEVPADIAPERPKRRASTARVGPCCASRPASARSGYDAGAHGGARRRHVHAGDWRGSAHPRAPGFTDDWVCRRGRRPARVPGVRGRVRPPGVRRDRASGSEALDAPRGGRSGSPRGRRRRRRASSRTGSRPEARRWAGTSSRVPGRSSGGPPTARATRALSSASVTSGATSGTTVLTPCGTTTVSGRRCISRCRRSLRWSPRSRRTGRPPGRRRTRRNGGCRRGCRRGAGGCRDSPPKVFDRVCWFAPRGGETAARWRREHRRRAGGELAGSTSTGTSTSTSTTSTSTSPKARGNPRPGLWRTVGEDEEGSIGNLRKRNRESSDEIEDGKEPPD